MQGQARGEVINYLRFTQGQEQALNRVVLIPSMPLHSSWAGLTAALRADHTFSHLCVLTSAVPLTCRTHSSIHTLSIHPSEPECCLLTNPSQVTCFPLNHFGVHISHYFVLLHLLHFITVSFLQLC